MSAPALRCFVQGCTERPVKVYTPMQGVTIRACARHADRADMLARTGRT